MCVCVCAYVLLRLLLFLLLLQVFHTSVSSLSFTGVWVTASRLQFPGHISGFWPISIMLWFGWSPLVLLFPTLLPPPLPSLCGVVPSALITIGITVNFILHGFLFVSQCLSIYLSIRFLWFSPSSLPAWQSPRFSMFSFFI